MNAWHSDVFVRYGGNADISCQPSRSVASPSLHAVLSCNSPADALKKAKSQASGSDISDVASEAKDKAKGLLKGKGISALAANPLAAVADLNKDVRGDAEDYRDPAGAVQQDNAAGEACGSAQCEKHALVRGVTFSTAGFAEGRQIVEAAGD
jgi:hypothetical protein